MIFFTRSFFLYISTDANIILSKLIKRSEVLRDEKLIGTSKIRELIDVVSRFFDNFTSYRRLSILVGVDSSSRQVITILHLYR